MTIFQLAGELYKQGVLLVPSVNKNSFVVPYAHWRENFPSEELYMGIWSAHKDKLPQLMCGIERNGHSVVMLDIDLKNDKTGTVVSEFEGLIQEYAPKLFSRLYIEETPSGGRHYGFKIEGTCPKKILAYADARSFEESMDDTIKKWSPIVELAGVGALCRIHPTPDFKVIQGSILDLPVISGQDLSWIEYLSIELNQKPPEVVTDQPRRERIEISSPGNDYSNNVPLDEFCDMLGRHGWTFKQRGQRIFLRHSESTRPEPNADIKNRVFKCYSGKQSAFQVGEPYALWRVYAILEHGADFIAAAKALREQGWGEEKHIEKAQGKPDTPEQKKEEDDFAAKVAATEIKLANPPKSIEYTLSWRSLSNGHKEGGIFDVAAPSFSVIIKGVEKSRKTSLLTSIVASGLCKDERCGFLWKYKGGTIVWIDTEQPEMWAFETKRRIMIQAGIRDDIPKLKFHALRSFKTVAERMKAVRHIVSLYHDLECLVIDGIKDLIDDFNDNKKADALVGEFLAMTESDQRRILAFHVIHVNKGNDFARGHLGGELTKKGDVVIDLDYDDMLEITRARFQLTRGLRPPSFEFHALDCNIPQIDGYPVPKYDFSIGSRKQKEEEKYFPKQEYPTSWNRQEPE